MKTASIPSVGTRTRRAIGAKQRLPHHPSTPRPLADGEISSDRPFEEGAHDAIDPELRHRLISEAAFDRYSKRGFADGHDVEDWLSAEAQIDHLLLNPQFSMPGD